MKQIVARVAQKMAVSVGEIDISTDRITKRGERILDTDLGEQPEALPRR